jgi:hypothetical protein
MNFFADPLFSSFLSFGVVFAGICLVIGLLLYVLSPRRDIRVKREPTVRKLAGVFEASATEYNFGYSVRLDCHFGGRPVILRLDDPMPKELINRSFHVLIGVSSPISYRVRHANAWTRVADKVGFSRDIETGIPEIDSRYVLSSSEPERFARWVVLSNAVQDAFKALLEDRGVDVLVQEKGYLEATTAKYSYEQTRPEFVRGLLDLMSVLAQAGEKI